MRRTLAAGLLLIMISGCNPLGGELGASSPAFNLVPDIDYMPKTGDRAFLYAMDNGTPLEQVPILSDVTAFDKYERVTRDSDSMELANMGEQKWLQWSPLGTRIYITRILDRNHTGARPAAEVRILDGPHKGRTVYTPITNIAQLKRADPHE